MPPVITPPIRTSLLTANGEPFSSVEDGAIQTTREWWMYWRKLGDQINQNAKLASGGLHASRPVAESMPDGALYVESDRNVIYQNQGGTWQYVAGTMYGTLSPDQRPADLGAFDAGFEFGSTDTNPDLAPRHFIWSGGQWIETTQVYYGTHAARPPADQTTPPRSLYVETDRGNVIYQQQANAWKYAAGIMTGTLSPDQRPAGLGANDTGFRFWTTDTKQTFRWSGSAWVDMAAAATPQNSAQSAQASASITLTTSFQTIPGCTLTVPRAGTYLVCGIFDFGASNDPGIPLLGTLSGQSRYAVFMTAAANARATVGQHWLVSLSAGAALTLVAQKTGGSGLSFVEVQSSITATWISP